MPLDRGGRPALEIPRQAERLMTTPEDFLSALPTEDRIGDDIWVERPVDLDTWLYDAAYMALDIRLSDIQREALQAFDDIDPTTNRFTEGVVEWGKGSGKDFICAIMAIRQIYFLLCLKDCYDYYGLAKNTGIQLVNVAYTVTQAQEVYFKQVKGILAGSPWFRRQNYTFTRSRIKFPHQVELVSAAADGDSLEGQNMFFAVMDEASAFADTKVVKAVARAEGVKAEKAADVIYNVLRTSTRSRFPRVGKVIMISYPRYRDDFIQTRRKIGEMSDTTFVSGPHATWEVNPRVSESDFRDDFEKRPEMAKAMYACDPPYSEDPYVARPYMFLKCVANTVLELPEVVNPIDPTGAYDTKFQGLPGRFYAIHIDSAIKKDRCALALARQGNSVIRKKCPCNKWNFPDVAVCSGCGRPEERWNRQELPTMVVTLLKSFNPRVSESGAREVQFSDVREEVLWVRDRGHFIWALSYDGWQSIDSIQTMSKILGTRKVRERYSRPGDEKEEEIVTTLSVDRNMEAHDTLKEFIYDQRFFITPPVDVKNEDDWETSMDAVAIAYREWRQLKVVNAKKVDHPLGGSKDFVDALAGAAYWIAHMPILRLHTSVVLGWEESVSSLTSVRR